MLVPQQTQASSLAGISAKLVDSELVSQDTSELRASRKVSRTFPVLQEQLPGALSGAG